jgi:hypothetical protein
MGDGSTRIGGETEEKAEKLPEISYADKMIVAVMGAVFNVIFAFSFSLYSFYSLAYPSQKAVEILWWVMFRKKL